MNQNEIILRGALILLRRAWWIAAVLASLWLPVVAVNVVIDPAADWVTKPATRVTQLVTHR